MVILAKPYGGISNRLFQHIHFNAFCLKHNISFANYFVSFPGANARPRGSLRRLSLRHLLVPFGAARSLRFETEGVDYSAAESIMREAKLVFVQGWAYRNLVLTRFYREYYRAAFYRHVPELDSKQILSPTKTNIALHIRRGDYTRWQGGKFCYADSVYLAALDQLSEIVRGQCRILIFTDDRKLDVGTYRSRHPDIYISRLSPRADHYLMSLCDYIIGPPSTFSLWASYIGKTKCCHINSPNDRIDANSFSICDG